MWETVVVVVIVSCCAFFVGRKFFRQYRSALDPSASTTCGCECSGCPTSGCDSNTPPREKDGSTSLPRA